MYTGDSEKRVLSGKTVRGMAEERENAFLFFYKDREFSFINEMKHYLEELQCPVCRSILQDPVQTSCGHSFCNECRPQQSFRRNYQVECHVCRSVCSVTEDPKEARRVKNLKVKCPNYHAGCEWKGTLGDSLQHCDQCLYEVIHCPNFEEGCDVRLQRALMQDHAEKDCEKRMYQCQYCRGEGVFSLVTGDHLKECRRYPLPCPNCCGVTEIPRENVDKHRGKCPNEVITCKFHNIGCTKTVQRRSLQEHLETDKDQHLDQALTKIAEMSFQFKNLEERLAALEQKNAQTVSQSLGQMGKRQWKVRRSGHHYN